MNSETITMLIIIWESANLYLNKAAGKINTIFLKEQKIHIPDKESGNKKLACKNSKCSLILHKHNHYK